MSTEKPSLVLRNCHAAIFPRIRDKRLEYSVLYNVDLELVDYRVLTKDSTISFDCRNTVITAGFFNGLSFRNNKDGVFGGAILVDKRTGGGKLVITNRESCRIGVVFIDTTENFRDDSLKALSSKDQIKVLWMSSTLDEVYKHYKEYGMFPVERLGRLRVLDSRVILAGIGWITSWEKEYIKNNDAWLAYSVRHHLWQKTRGFIPVRDILDNTMLSTYYFDNTPVDMLTESAFLYVLNNNVFGGDDIRPIEAIKLLHNGWRLCFNDLDIEDIPWKTGLQLVGLPRSYSMKGCDDIDCLLETLFLDPARLGRVIMFVAKKLYVEGYS